MITLLASSAVAVELSGRANLQTLMCHQEHVAHVSKVEKQRYAEMGWKAARLDAANDFPPEMVGDADIVNLPRARHFHSVRRDGSA
ncbi:hypothetical protein [Streptomyces sp. NPDC005548]|uniref:hypothetical protein n=1 Tax=Streptomyces sp. NPDC005548 TaxID=3364724 RepID=UPI00369E3D03